MKKVIKITSLKKIFNVPVGCCFTINDYRYHGSLVPKLEILKTVTKIDFKITFRKPNHRTSELPHNNPVNTHIFKPKYFKISEERLMCYVSNIEVLAHTLRSLAVINDKYFHKDIQITVLNLCDKYHKFCQKWPMNENLLITRVESAINYLRMIWLINNKKVKKADIKKLFKAIELSRLKPSKQSHIIAKAESKYLKSSGFSFEKIDRELCIKRYKSSSPYIEMASALIGGVPISIIQLPWGYSMSVKMVKFILKKNHIIKKIGIVGGIGYLGKENVKIDDVFIPKSLIKFNGKESIQELIRNKILDLPDTKCLFKKKEAVGNIYSVRPTLGKISYTKHVKDLGNIHAYDMEKEGMIELLKDPDIEIASCYYIMDYPYTNKDLGGTYYSHKFLKKLFSKTNRGKYHCFEKILFFLTNQ